MITGFFPWEKKKKKNIFEIQELSIFFAQNFGHAIVLAFLFYLP